MFSRACGFIYYVDRVLKIRDQLPIYIQIGCGNSDKNIPTIQINNPKDKTMKDDMSIESLTAHWTLTPTMLRMLDRILSSRKSK